MPQGVNLIAVRHTHIATEVIWCVAQLRGHVEGTSLTIDNRQVNHILCVYLNLQVLVSKYYFAEG